MSYKVFLFDECKCESRYSIEPHGEGYALYYERCNHRHGYNLVNMVEPAFNFDPKHIEKLINLGNAGYQKNPNRGHVAE
jgi:S-adenosylmethionine synthetase